MLPGSMQKLVDLVTDRLSEYPQLPAMFAATFANTYETTLRPQPDGSTFVITGDIPAMWLRDSAAQVRPYLRLAAVDQGFAALIAGVVARQVAQVLTDPYANAFNQAPNGRCHNRDQTDMGPWIWERKYELDSLCAPLMLAHGLWQATGQVDHLGGDFARAAALIVATITTEQDHSGSPYTFERLEGPSTDTLSCQGRGSPVGDTGMSWSGFRPSDDACQYHYLIPANMMAAVALEQLAALPLGKAALSVRAQALAQEIRGGIAAHGVVDHPRFGAIYAYEVDGLGQYNLMDDANVPSLLAMPYIGFCVPDDPVYRATRAFALSKDNPYYYQGSAASGIGSPHTPADHVWPIALAMQGLTAPGRAEKLVLLEQLMATDAGTGLIHESVHKDDPTRYTRPWFAWANALFAEFVLDLCDVA